MPPGDRPPRPARHARRPPPPKPARPAVQLAHAAPPDARSFEDDGVLWLVWVAGQGLGGTGEAGLGRVDAIHFARADQPERPLLEALSSRGSLGALYPEELRRLRATARPIEPPADEAAATR